MTVEFGGQATLTDAELLELVELLRSLIRIPSVNPPLPEAPDGELVAARFLEQTLEAEGLRPTVVEPFPGARVHRRASPRRWNRRRAAAPPLAPGCGSGPAGGMEPRSIRRRPRRRLRLGAWRDRHEGHGGDGGAGHAPPRPSARAAGLDPAAIQSRGSVATSSSAAPRTRKPAESHVRAGSSTTTRSGSGPPRH